MHPVKYGAHHLQQRRQQLMDGDGSSPSPSSVFSISNPPQQSVFPFNYSLQSQQQKHYQNLSQNQNLFQGPVITHELFHQFQTFQQQQDEPVHQHQQQPFLAVDFKLGLNENTGKKEAALALNHQQQNESTFLHGNKQQNSLLMPHCWNPQEDSTIKESFWKPLNRCEDRQCSGDEVRQIEGNIKYDKFLQQPGCQSSTSDRTSKDLNINKYRLFGELEAIYNGPAAAKGRENAQACSGSALTGDENSPANTGGLSMPLSEFQGHLKVGANRGVGNNGSETSIGEEAASLRKIQKKKMNKKKMKEQLSSMAVFFESLVKQVTDHQESLHKRFLEVIERMEKERSAQEESWRRQEAEKRNREAIARAHEQALASSREALIVSCLEKITGQSINLPARAPILLQLAEISAIEPFNETAPALAVKVVDNNVRWPRAEVEALIQVRCNLESKFREPGLKGPLWEEVSSFMTSLGYSRSAKRCKEKWENINKYFRKSKENGGKKRSQHSKTCSYFDQLDQLYSRIIPTSPRPLIDSDNIDMQQQADDSDILEAYMAERDIGTSQVNSSGILKVSEMMNSSSKLDFDGAVTENVVKGKGMDNEDEREDDDNDSYGGE